MDKTQTIDFEDPTFTTWPNSSGQLETSKYERLKIDEGEPKNSTRKTLAKIDKNQTIDSKTQPLQPNPIQGGQPWKN